MQHIEKNSGRPSKDKISDGNDKNKSEIVHEMGFTDRQARDFQTLAKHPETVERAKEDAELALKLKPVIEEQAKQRMSDGAKGTQISAEAKGETRDKPQRQLEYHTTQSTRLRRSRRKPRKKQKRR